MTISLKPHAVPSVKDVRSTMPQDARERSTAMGLALFLVTAFFWTASFACILLLPDLWMKLLAGALGTFFTSFLFVIGHDACHGSLTPKPWLNKLLGRLAFLPSYHPYTSWEHSHNGLHHGWTNLRGKDPVYVPFSKSEFDALPKTRQLLERLYRSAPGLGLFYFVEVWWKYKMFPRPSKATSGRPFQLDRLLVVAFALLQAVALLTLTGPLGPHPLTRAAALLVVGIIVPFAAFNWSMGFVTFQHHTHPDVPWYGNEAEWGYFAGQVRSVAHVKMPKPIELLLHNIMVHTAHHADPKIPLYNLPECQRRLEEKYAAVVEEDWTLSGFLRTLRVCKLYDYQTHRWTNFAGHPTTDRMLQLPHERTHTPTP